MRVHGNCSKCTRSLRPLTSLKQGFCLQKRKRNRAVTDKDARCDGETIDVGLHGYVERLVSTKGCLTEGVAEANLQVFGKIHGKSANPNAFLANPQIDSRLLHAISNVLNPASKLLSNNPGGSNTISPLSLNGGDDGSGSGGLGGGSGWDNLGPDGHFNRHIGGLAILGMHTFLLGIEEGRFSDHEAAFRNASYFGQKFSLQNCDAPVNASAEIYVMHGDKPCCEQEDEIQVNECNMEAAMDYMGSLAESEQNMELLSSSFSSSPMRVQKAAHHGSQDGSGWLGRLAHPASARQASNREDTSPTKQVAQHESRVSPTEGMPDSPKVDPQTGATSTIAKQSDVDTLKRLQREAFSELMKLRDKLEKLEQLAQARQKLDKVGAGRTHLHGHAKAGTAFVLLEDSSSRHARDSLEQAGMQTGLDVNLTFETPFREKDMLITQCLSGEGSSVGDGRALGGPLRVGKLHYVAQVTDDVSFSFVPLGAQGKDVTEIINVLQDQGLTAFSSQGPALFNDCKGSALGATVSGSRFAFSLAQYLSGWGNHVSAAGSLSEEDPLCLSTLGQLLLQPTEGFIVSLSGLNRYWPSPPPPSSMALHWSEMGPLVIPKFQSYKEKPSHTFQSGSRGGSSLVHMKRTGSHWENPDLEYGVSAFESEGAGLLSLAICSSFDLSDDVSVSGWAQIEKGEICQDPNRGNVQWAFSVGKTSGNGICWGASIGASRQDLWSMTTNNTNEISGYDDGNHPQLHVEAFLKLNFGRGFTFQPGLLYVSNKHSRTPAFVMRSSWSL